MAIFTFRRLPRPSYLLLLFGHVCSRRRAMVNKLWCRELAEKWFQAKFDPPAGRCFSEPRWQERLECWYLLYRWLILLLWAGITVCSILELGSIKPLGAPELWPIYLTNWDLGLGLSQALLAVVLVTRRWRLQARQPGSFDPREMEFGRLERAYWFLNVVTTSLALGVTVIYWTLVHDPRIHQLDAQNFMVHVGNSALMLLDLGMAKVPFELRCFWWCPFLVSFYVLFSLVYFAAGGLNKNGEPRIYNILDWQRPVRTLLVCAGCLTFLVLTHCLLYALAGLRDRLQLRRRTSCYVVEKQHQQQQKQDKLGRKDEFCV